MRSLQIWLTNRCVPAFRSLGRPRASSDNSLVVHFNESCVEELVLLIKREFGVALPAQDQPGDDSLVHVIAQFLGELIFGVHTPDKATLGTVLQGHPGAAMGGAR